MQFKWKAIYQSKIIALHFVSNPNNYKFIRYNDGDTTNYHSENLTWISKDCNRSQDHFEDELPFAIEITHYNNHQFKDYFFNRTDEQFYHYTGVNYRQIGNRLKKNKYLYVRINDVNGKQIDISYEEFKRQYKL